MKWICRNGRNPKTCFQLSGTRVGKTLVMWFNPSDSVGDCFSLQYNTEVGSHCKERLCWRVILRSKIWNKDMGPWPDLLVLNSHSNLYNIWEGDPGTLSNLELHFDQNYRILCVKAFFFFFLPNSYIALGTAQSFPPLFLGRMSKTTIKLLACPTPNLHLLRGCPDRQKMTCASSSPWKQKKKP